MPKTRVQKEEFVKDLSDKLGKVKSVIFANFDHLKVLEITQLRKNFRAEGIDYVVAKKTLLKRSLEANGLNDVAVDKLPGSVATILSYTDEVAPARIVAGFAKDHEALKMVGGILEHHFVDQNAVIELSKLPSKEELLAKMVGSLASPLSGLVNVLQGNLRNFVYALLAVRDKKTN